VRRRSRDLRVAHHPLDGEIAHVAVSTKHLHRLRRDRHRGVGRAELWPSMSGSQGSRRSDRPWHTPHTGARARRASAARCPGTRRARRRDASDGSDDSPSMPNSGIRAARIVASNRIGARLPLPSRAAPSSGRLEIGRNRHPAVAPSTSRDDSAYRCPITRQIAKPTRHGPGGRPTSTNGVRRFRPVTQATRTRRRPPASSGRTACGQHRSRRTAPIPARWRYVPSGRTST
jgi:hypothetical protein